MLPCWLRLLGLFRIARSIARNRWINSHIQKICHHLNPEANLIHYGSFIQMVMQVQQETTTNGQTKERCSQPCEILFIGEAKHFYLVIQQTGKTKTQGTPPGKQSAGLPSGIHAQQVFSLSPVIHQWTVLSGLLHKGAE